MAFFINFNSDWLKQSRSCTLGILYHWVTWLSLFFQLLAISDFLSYMFVFDNSQVPEPEELVLELLQ